MSSYEIRITHSAKNDLDTIRNHLSVELNEPDVALKLSERLKKAILSLSTMPERHPFILDETLAELKIRKFISKKHVIFYRIEEKTVIILRVVYIKRNWQHLI